MRQSGGRMLLGNNTGGGVVMLGVGVSITTVHHRTHIHIQVNVTTGCAYTDTERRQRYIHKFDVQVTVHRHKFLQ